MESPRNGSRSETLRADEDVPWIFRGANRNRESSTAIDIEARTNAEPDNPRSGLGMQNFNGRRNSRVPRLRSLEISRSVRPLETDGTELRDPSRNARFADSWNLLGTNVFSLSRKRNANGRGRTGGNARAREHKRKEGP